MLSRLLLVIVWSVFSTSVLAAFTTTGCGNTKGCYRFPTNCLPSSPTCTFFSWKWNPTLNTFEMELSGGTGGGMTYSAVAFSKARKMANADLYYCTGTALLTGAITEEKQPPLELSLSSYAGVAQTSASTKNGVAECTFTRTSSITPQKPVTSGTDSFDLSSGSFWLLFAQGPFEGAIDFHDTYGFSSSAVNLMALFSSTSTSAVNTSTTVSSTTSPGVTITSPANRATVTSPGTINQAKPATGCGITKGCFEYPSGCSKESPDCVFFSWFWNATESSFEMELSGGGGGNTYAAIAFAREKKMANADMYYCTGTLFTGSIKGEKQRPTTLSLTSYPGIVSLTSEVSNGVAQCKFKRPQSVTKPVTSGDQVFDLSSQNYWLLIAAGPYSSGDIQYHTDRGFSSSAVDLTAFTGASGSGADILDKVHGSLMIVAWLVLVNIGAVIARHFKPLWPNTKPCGEKAWFQMHRTLMLSTVTITLIAFIIIFVEVGKYDETIGAHAIIGIVVMVLALLNPIIALFRCHPGSERRPIFNAVHWFVGFSARSLGVANLFLGVELTALGLPIYTTYVLGGFVGFIVLCEIIFEILSWNFGHISYGKSKKDDTPVPDSTLNIEEPNVRVRGQEVKSFLLAIYVIGNLCFAISLWVAISNT